MGKRSAICLIVGLIALSCGAASANFVAYNDCVYSSNPVHNHAPLQPNVTTYNIGNTSPGPTSGLLKDFYTGATTGVTATLTQSGGVVWQPEGAVDNYYGGADCAVGTDAYSVFNPSTASLVGVIYYGSSGWYVDLTFTGLDPSKSYEFVTSANRNRLDNTYNDRVTRYHIDSVDSCVNTSTPGVTISSAGLTDRFNTGNNYSTGYVARWTDIRPGADGSFWVRAEAGSTAQVKAYAFSAFRLTEFQPVPEPSCMVAVAAGLVALLRRRARK